MNIDFGMAYSAGDIAMTQSCRSKLQTSGPRNLVPWRVANFRKPSGGAAVGTANYTIAGCGALPYHRVMSQMLVKLPSTAINPSTTTDVGLLRRLVQGLLPFNVIASARLWPRMMGRIRHPSSP